MSLIDVRELSFAYGAQRVLDKLSFAVEAEDFMAVLGPNGSGKTTLMHLLAGLLKPQTGQIQINGRALQRYARVELARVLAMVRQDTSPAFGFTVRETVMMARYLAGESKLFQTRQDRDIVEQAMERTDTQRFADRPLNALSGGERQRVFIARALAQQTPVLLLDEPTSHLDLKHQMGIFDLLRQLRQKEHKTIIVVSHDINLIQHYADTYLMLAADGRMRYERNAKGLDAAAVETFFGVRGVEGVVGGQKVFVPLSIAE